MSAKIINVEIYTKDFADNASVTAKQAKEIFFLTADDLKYMDFHRPKGYGAYFMKTGSCKCFNAREVRRKAISKFGSISALIKKAESLNQRRKNKVERDEIKRKEEERRRKEAADEAERKRLADIEAKKQARLEKKRQAEQQMKDAESWRALVKALEGTDVDIQNTGSLSTLLNDINDWKKSKLSITSRTPKALKTNIAAKNVSPN
eukprot:CAMPEP_0194250682 /NCGR_PEP_ID=MMETSP0158-20130606/23738_1 /TAXON_ID=33649 /ORGANISM="Thalassionema nitzschioides, Strain L26-B" /LENGTH=205 /DNA_ID=CAMNT_0038987587 /DNA_START=12 /DNA_END=629 /DNA_ORIENTATION=+